MNENKEFMVFLLNEYFSLNGSLLLTQYSNIEQRIRGLKIFKTFESKNNTQLIKWLHSIVCLIQLIDYNHHPRLENVQIGCSLLNITIAEIPNSYLAYFNVSFLNASNHSRVVNSKSVAYHFIRSLCLVEKSNLRISGERGCLNLLDLFKICTCSYTTNSLLLCLIDIDSLYIQQFISFQNDLSNWIRENLFEPSNGWDTNTLELCGVLLARIASSAIDSREIEDFWSGQNLRWIKTTQELSNQIFGSFPSLSRHTTPISLEPFQIKNSLPKTNFSIELFASQVNNLSRALLVVANWPFSPIGRALFLGEKISHNTTSFSIGLNLELSLPYLLELLQGYRLLDQYLTQNSVKVDKGLQVLSNTLRHHLGFFLKYTTPILIEYTHISHNPELCEFIQIYLIREYTSTTFSHSIQHRKGLIYNMGVYFNKFQFADSSWNCSQLIFQLIQDSSIKPRNSTKFNTANTLGGFVVKKPQKRLKAIQLTNSDALQTQTTVYTTSDLYLNTTQLILHIIRQGWYKLSTSQQSAVLKMVTDHLDLFIRGQLELGDKYLITLLKIADILAHIPHSNQTNMIIVCFELYHTFRLARGGIAEYCKHGIGRISRLIHPELLQIDKTHY